ncbi:alpha/beta fold hydrolase [Christiangramia salexigens]|uniref:Alpha/beta hydrolase n=1 Tax=Christiangramia salexigens TaxID=1913577 RepID=A0A1L3J2Z7_9FLAO|nr:alpha/beta hydrolase [Christiangramia salexigens]APG59498.1 alpha/beta hydrolase [Christiangramia salexigens]
MSVKSQTNIVKRNNIKIKGKGTQPMIFAHGYGCDQNMWRFIVPAFEEDYKIILFDHVGAGNSDAKAYSKDKYSSLKGYAEDILEICDALQLEDVILVGHSVSSMIAVLAANKKPSIFSKLILIGPSPRYINENSYKGGFEREDIDELMEALDSNYLGWSNNMAPVIMGTNNKAELGEELANSFCRTDPEIAKHFASVTFLSDNREDLTKVKVPSLILQCSEDVLAPLVVGEYIHENIQNSSLRVLKATGHCPNLSAPEETIEVMKDYLEKSS